MTEEQYSTPTLLPLVLREINDETINTVNARDLHAFLEIAKDYSNWIKAQLKRGKFVEGKHYIRHQENGIDTSAHLGDKAKRTIVASVDYFLTFDTAKHIAMMANVEKGHKVREYFIEKERELNSLRQSTAHILTPSQALLQQVALLGQQVALIVKIEERQSLVESRQDEHEAALAAIKERRPPQGKMRVEDWLRREGKPFLEQELLRHLRYACSQRESPAEFRPEGMDFPLRYYTPSTIADAYEEVTRQLRFLIHDPGVKYHTRRRV